MRMLKLAGLATMLFCPVVLLTPEAALSRPPIRRAIIRRTLPTQCPRPKVPL